MGNNDVNKNDSGYGRADGVCHNKTARVLEPRVEADTYKHWGNYWGN